MSAPSPLSPNEAAVVEGLRRDGVFVTSLENLGVEQAENIPILRSGAQITDVLAKRVAALNQQTPCCYLQYARRSAREPSDLSLGPERDAVAHCRGLSAATRGL